MHRTHTLSNDPGSMPHFGRLIGAMISDRGTTQNRIAAAARVQSSTISRWRQDSRFGGNIGTLAPVLGALADLKPITPKEDQSLREALGNEYANAVDREWLEHTQAAEAGANHAMLDRLMATTGPEAVSNILTAIQEAAEAAARRLNAHQRAAEPSDSDTGRPPTGGTLGE